MPVQVKAKPTKKRITNENLFAILDGQVLPEIREVKGILKKAGLDNGHAEDVKLFFDERAQSAAARLWMGRKLRPLVKFKYVIAGAGFVSTVAWGVLAVRQVWTVFPHH